MDASLQQILAIRGNQAVYDRLKELLKDGSAIAFLGAGTSVPLYPLWGELIAKLHGVKVINPFRKTRAGGR